MLTEIGCPYQEYYKCAYLGTRHLRLNDGWYVRRLESSIRALFGSATPTAAELQQAEKRARIMESSEW
jgi:hypothetical protein